MSFHGIERKCSVLKCRIRYPKKKNKQYQIVKNISVFSIPDKETDPEMPRKWVRAIPCKEWEPSKHSDACKLHFKKYDLWIEKTTMKGDMVLNRINVDAVPSMFHPIIQLKLQPIAVDWQMVKGDWKR